MKTQQSRTSWTCIVPWCFLRVGLRFSKMFFGLEDVGRHLRPVFFQTVLKRHYIIRITWTCGSCWWLPLVLFVGSGWSRSLGILFALKRHEIPTGLPHPNIHMEGKPEMRGSSKSYMYRWDFPRIIFHSKPLLGIPHLWKPPYLPRAPSEVRYSTLKAIEFLCPLLPRVLLHRVDLCGRVRGDTCRSAANCGAFCGWVPTSASKERFSKYKFPV